MCRKLIMLFTRSTKRNTSGESQFTSHAQAGFTSIRLVPMRLKKYRAFSFVEVIIIVLFLGIFAAIAVPRFNRAAISKNKAQTTARKIVADLRLTRRLAISDATTNTKGFALTFFGAGGQGDEPYTRYEIYDLDEKKVVGFLTINPEVTCAGGDRFVFGPLGNLESGSGAEITVSAEGKTFTITIIPATGAVKCVEN